MIDEAELRRMSLSERRQLARTLAEMDGPEGSGAAVADPYVRDPALRRQRRVALLVLAGCCVILAGWIVVLSLTLPHRFDAHHWRAVWVNFDLFLLVAFALTAWALWRQRQVVILLLMATGTMLCCDAWFDVGTSLKTSGIWLSLASAFFAELPLAFLAFVGARRLLKATVEAAEPVPADVDEAGPSLRRTPLSGAGLDEALPGGLTLDRAERARG